MKRLVFLVSVFVCLFTLSGCGIISSLLGGNKNTIDDLSVEYDSNELEYKVKFSTPEKTGDYNATISIRSSDSILLYYKNFNDNTNNPNYEFTILSEDIKNSSTDIGELTVTFNIEGAFFEDASVSINNLVVGENENTSFEYLIEETSTTLAFDDMLSNSWGAKKSDTELANMTKLYTEFENSIAYYLVDGEGLYSDTIIDSTKNCFLAINVSSYKLSKIYVYEVLLAVLYDNPLFYFVDKSSYTTSQGSNIHTIYLVVSEEYASNDVRTYYNNVIVEYFEECDLLLQDVSSDLEKSLILHDKIVKDAFYDYSYDVHCFNIIGVVASKGAVCESYAETYSMLLNYYGINAYLIIGFANNGSQIEAHAWNLIQINNEWYWVDVTWDDNGNSSNHMYFGKGSNSNFLSNHTVGEHGLYIDPSIIYMVSIPTVSTNNLVIS